MADISLMTWQEVRKFSAQGAMALIPVGSLEQHGPHLVVETDTQVVTKVAAEVIKKLEAEGVKVGLTPTLWVGCSPHHLDLFTISLNPDVYIKVIESMAESLIAAGFKKVFFLNGHGGNSAPLQIAFSNIAIQYDILVGGGTYWELGAKSIGRNRSSVPGGMAHACELETSLMQYLMPGGVRPGLIAKHIPELPARATVDMLEAAPLKLGFRFSDLNPNGNLGDPTLASAEKGQRFFEGIVADVTEALLDFYTLKIGKRTDFRKCRETGE